MPVEYLMIYFTIQYIMKDSYICCLFSIYLISTKKDKDFRLFIKFISFMEGPTINLKHYCSVVSQLVFKAAWVAK